MQDWQNEWDEFNHSANEPARQAEVERNSITHMETHSQQLETRYQRLQDEMQGLDASDAVVEVEMLSEQIESEQLEAESLQESRQQTADKLNEQREQVSQFTQQISEHRNQWQSLTGRISSLEALQETALGKSNSQVGKWLDENGLASASRLAQGVEAESGWEKAVESVLGFHLEAVCVDDFDSIVQSVAALETGSLELFKLNANAQSVAENPAIQLSPLWSKLSSQWPMEALFNGIYCADDLPQALAAQSFLRAHESIVTRSGEWIGSQWVRITRGKDEKAGVLHREKSLREAIAQKEVLGEKIDTAEMALDGVKENLTQLEEERESIQSQLSEYQRRLGDLKASRSGKQARLDQVNKRKDSILGDLEELQMQIQANAEVITESRGRLEEAVESMEALEMQRETLQERREELRLRLDEVRAAANQDGQALQALTVEYSSVKSNIESTRQSLNRVDNQLGQLESRRNSLQDS
jgi:chromosome segregation protein